MSNSLYCLFRKPNVCLQYSSICKIKLFWEHSEHFNEVNIYFFQKFVKKDFFRFLRHTKKIQWEVSSVYIANKIKYGPQKRDIFSLNVNYYRLTYSLSRRIFISGFFLLLSALDISSLDMEYTWVNP